MKCCQQLLYNIFKTEQIICGQLIKMTSKSQQLLQQQQQQRHQASQVRKWQQSREVEETEDSLEATEGDEEMVGEAKTKDPIMTLKTTPEVKGMSQIPHGTRVKPIGCMLKKHWRVNCL